MFEMYASMPEAKSLKEKVMFIQFFSFRTRM